VAQRPDFFKSRCNAHATFGQYEGNFPKCALLFVYFVIEMFIGKSIDDPSVVLMLRYILRINTDFSTLKKKEKMIKMGIIATLKNLYFVKMTNIDSSASSPRCQPYAFIILTNMFHPSLAEFGSL
jgi:hypothetical protein